MNEQMSNYYTEWAKYYNERVKKWQRGQNLCTIGLAACMFALGIGCGMLFEDWLDSHEEVDENGLCLDSQRTSATLMVVGMNALNDELYDEYEIHQMLKKAEL